MLLFAINQFVPYVLGAFFIGSEVGVQEIGEEEQLQDNKDKEQFYDYEHPQRFPDCHVSETVNIQVDNASYQVHCNFAGIK